jgi:hypothetical protein
MRRCEREAWPISERTTLFGGTIKFAGLYFAVVALGPWLIIANRLAHTKRSLEMHQHLLNNCCSDRLSIPRDSSTSIPLLA